MLRRGASFAAGAVSVSARRAVAAAAVHGVGVVRTVVPLVRATGAAAGARRFSGARVWPRRAGADVAAAGAAPVVVSVPPMGDSIMEATVSKIERST